MKEQEEEKRSIKKKKGKVQGLQEFQKNIDCQINQKAVKMIEKKHQKDCSI